MSPDNTEQTVKLYTLKQQTFTTCKTLFTTHTASVFIYFDFNN